MSGPDIIVIVAVVLVLVVSVAVAFRLVAGRRALRERFGDEYDRVVSETGGRTAAEAELRRRERVHAELPLRDLSDEERVSYRDGWTAVQNQFVDDPAAAVHAADQLVSRLVADRGYPVVDYPDRLAHLSVEHADVLSLYRDAHDIGVRNDAGTATTEELRRALVNYRELVTQLLGEHPVAAPATPGGTPSPAASTPRATRHVVARPVAFTPLTSEDALAGRTRARD